MPVNQESSNTQTGAGQMTPLDHLSDFTVIRFIAKQLIAELEIMMPVQVVKVTPGSGTPPAAGTVDVQLLVSLLDGNGNAQKQGIIQGVPYFRIQGGAWGIVMDPAVNDFGYILTASRDISNVIKTPGVANPGSLRRHRYSDGIYMGGIMNKAPTQWAWFKSDGTFQFQDQTGNVIQADTNGITLTPASGKPMTINGNVTMSGSLTVQTDIHANGAVIAGYGGADQVGLQTHRHGGVSTGSGFTIAPQAGS